MVTVSDDDRDPEYIPPDTHKPTHSDRISRGMLYKVASGVVSNSLSNEECILTCTPFGSTADFQGASGSEETSDSKEGSPSDGSTTPPALFYSTLFDEADSACSTPAPQTNVPAPVANQPNW